MFATIGLSLIILGVALSVLVQNATKDRVSSTLIGFAFGLSGGALFWGAVLGLV